ncbi:MAG: cell division protein SepF [Clostridia bacterium]|nr:cell division protein SepF [Clostridia bacterium]
MGLMNWLLKGIGFEDEEDQEAESIRHERKLQKERLKEAKRKEREAQKLEKTNQKLSKLEKKNSQTAQIQPSETKSSYASDPDQYNISPIHQETEQENYGGYGSDYSSSNNMGGYGSKNVVFFYPKSYEEVQKVIDFLKQGESVMLNLDNISDAEAQRMLDFASGAIYALNGSLQRVSANIFLLTPEGLNIMVPKQ